MTEASTTRIHIWDHPESKIAFMETMLKGQSWEAVVHHPGGHAALKPIQQQFHTRNFAATLEHDEQNESILAIRHFGDETRLFEAAREMGLVRGARHTFENIGIKLGKLVKRGRQTLSYFASDPARALASLYLIGDLILTLAGVGNKDSSEEKASFMDRLKDPANFLESFAGVMATIQSLIFMSYAKSGPDLALEDLIKSADKALSEGKDLREVETWLHAEGMEQARGFLSGIDGFLKRHPIQSGSTAQILGQVALLSSGFLRRNDRMKELQDLQASGVENAERAKELEGEIKSGFQDMMTGISSIMGWTAMMYPQKHHEEKHSILDPRRLWQEFEGAPNKASTLLLTAATASGMKAAYDKKNWIKMGGYVTYLMGDALMFFTNSAHYGTDAAGAEGVVAEALAKFIGKLSVALGPDAEREVIRGAAQQLALRAALAGKEDQQETLERNPQFQKQVEEQAARIMELTQGKLMGQPRPFDQVITDMATLVSRYGEEDRAAVLEGLSATVAESSGIAASPEELTARTNALLATVENTRRTKSPTVQELTADAARLVNHIPGFATPENVSRLFDVLAEKARAVSADQERLGRAVVATAAKEVGVPSPVPMPSLGGMSMAPAY